MRTNKILGYIQLYYSIFLYWMDDANGLMDAKWFICVENCLGVFLKSLFEFVFHVNFSIIFPLLGSPFDYFEQNVYNIRIKIRRIQMERKLKKRHLQMWNWTRFFLNFLFWKEKVKLIYGFERCIIMYPICLYWI